MAKFCRTCNRPKKDHFMGHICDLVGLSDGRLVHVSRVATGGDIRDELGDDLKVVHRNITPEMRLADDEIKSKKEEKAKSQ